MVFETLGVLCYDVLADYMGVGTIDTAHIPMYTIRCHLLDFQQSSKLGYGCLLFRTDSYISLCVVHTFAGMGCLLVAADTSVHIFYLYFCYLFSNSVLLIHLHLQIIS